MGGQQKRIISSTKHIHQLSSPTSFDSTKFVTG